MSSFHSNDPRAVRTRHAFRDAFIELLQTKTYQSITVTDIAKRAGFARHTFYNHYETKEHLLSKLIDAVLDKFFSKLAKWDFNLNEPEDEINLISSFFYVWKNNVEIVRILKKLKEKGKTVIAATHDERIMQLADWTLRPKDGRIVNLNE